jgi:MFS family permease
MRPDVKSPAVRINRAGRIMLLLSGCCGIFATYVLTPVLPAIAAHFAGTPAAEPLTRMLVSVIGVMIVIGSPLSGVLADRFGARRTLLGALILYAIAGCAGGALDSLYALLVTRVLVGFATAAEGTASLALLVRYSDSSTRNAWLGYISTAGALIGLVLIPASSYIGNLGWRWVFALYLITLPLSLLALMGFERDQPALQVSTHGEHDGYGVQQFPWALLAFSLATGVVVLTPVVYIPFHVRDIGVVDPGRIGMALLPSSVATALTAVFFGRLRARLSLEAAFVVGFCIDAAGLAVAGFSQEYWQVLTGVALLGVGFGILGPNILALAGMTGPPAHGAKTMGIARAGLYGGTMVGQILLEPIASRSTAGGVLLFLSVLAVALALVRLGRGIYGRALTGT